MATVKVKWSVQELANVMTLFTVQKVYRATVGMTGPYVEITSAPTRVPLVADVTDYYFDDIAGSPAYWYKISYYNGTTLLESELSDPVQGTGGGNYLSVQDMRDAGFGVSQASDARVVEAIELAESFLEEATGRWFYPRSMSLRVDGNHSRILPLPHPIIQVDIVKFLATTDSPSEILTEVDSSTFRVYNRHLTMGLSGNDDDRNAPRIEYQPNTGIWFRSAQNIQVDGWFGYTVLGRGDPIGETVAGSQKPLSMGRTPPLVKSACILLAARYLPLPGDQDAWEDALRRHSITQMSTRDQSITFGSQAGGSAGNLSGDAIIDRVLGMYTSPPSIAFV